jgi:primosomal protein N' (replication factor Y)
MRYAQVAVLLPIDKRLAENKAAEGAAETAETLVDFRPESQTFTYGIPPGRRGVIRPGHVVWVPFGRSQQQGVVLSLSDDAPADVLLKPLGDLVAAEPALSPALIELAQWLCRHYLAPLSECVRLLLPPGFGAKSKVLVEYAPGAPIYPDDLTPAQQVLLLRLRKGPLLLRDLREIDRRLAAEEVLGEVLKMGLARLRDQADDALPRPKTERRLRLAIPPDEIEAALTRFGRPSKGADALRWLADHPTAQPTLVELAGTIDASPAPLRTLAERGLVEITAERRVRLSIPPAEVNAAIIALRGTEKYRPILEALRRAGGEPVWVGWLYAEADTDAAAVRTLAEAGLVEVIEAEVWRDPLAGRRFEADTPPALTGDQEKAWAEIEVGLAGWLGEEAPAGDLASPPVYLLHGVTGSGKTEIYLRALAKTLIAGRQAIILIPEISLTPQTVRRFAARFPGRVAVVHSKLSEGERYDTWRRARQGEFDVVVGSRSALFTPFPRLGLVVLDEEHDAAYKQARTPRYHARETALALARLSGAVTILGSATPSLESAFQARRGVYHRLDLPRRVRGHQKTGDGGAAMLDLPPVEIVDMREELRAGNRSMFSRRLAQTLQGVLARGEQAILFLNRRGAASFVLCRDCGEVIHCRRCAIPLTVHGDSLLCHHCNYRQSLPQACPKCKSRRFKEFGAGTERLLEALTAEFPAARPLRWDRDTTGGKTSHEDILQDFIDHKADVLVGTQMIAKGLDLPLVTLVGVLSADVGLFLPDFRAAERTFQVLTQVAGRAGRSALGGQVIFQTYHPHHYAVLAAAQHDYAAFYEQEMRYRQTNGYPPYRRLTRLLYLDTNRERCQRETERLAAQLKQRAAALGCEDVSLIGPAPAFFSKERDLLRWHLLIRSEDPAALLAGVRLTPNWRIDVDPVETL